jgi:hypothetical protein
VKPFALFFIAGALLAQSSAPLTDQRIIDLAHGGVKQDELIRLISTAPDIAFDLTPTGEQRMMDAGLTEEIIKAMATRENGGSIVSTNPASASRHGEATNNGFRTVTALANRMIPHHNSFAIDLPGRVDTSCYGTGSAWSYAAVNCSSIVTPPSEIPVDISWVEVYQQVSSNGVVYTLKCTAHWIGSACGSLESGGTFPVEIRGKSMWIEVHRDGNMGKVLHSKFQILDIRQDASISRPTPQSLAITFMTPIGWTRKDYPQYSELTSSSDSTFVMGIYHDAATAQDAAVLLSTAVGNALERAHGTIFGQGEVSLFKTAAGYNVAARQLVVKGTSVPPYWLVAAVPGNNVFSFMLCAASTHGALVSRIQEINSILDSLRMEQY